MKSELSYIIEQLKDAYEGDPWFGRNAKALLAEADEENAFEKPGEQHSIVELVWHMITWKEFAISRLDPEATQDMHYYESRDWSELDHNDKSHWQQGLKKLFETHEHLIEIISKQNDELLHKNVPERNYTFRKLLYGILQHDIYHLGQIAYIIKLLKSN